MGTKQPKALKILFFVEMCQDCSYYGMRVLLVLYMIERLKMSDMEYFKLRLYHLHESRYSFAG